MLCSIVKMLEEIYIETNFHIGNLDLNKFPVMEFAYWKFQIESIPLMGIT